MTRSPASPKSFENGRESDANREALAARGDSLHHFDSHRRDFAPYGFTCEIWEPRQMQRPDRHDEIEINFLDRGTLTYLIGGERVTVHPRRVTAFWAAVPHQIVAFNKVSYYYVVTVPFGWVLQWGLPERLMTALTQGQIVADARTDRAKLDQQLFEQWHEDVEKLPNSNREVVVLELRARLLRLAESVLEPIGLADKSDEGGGSRQQNNLEKAEAMACFVARNYTSRIQIKDVAECIGLHPDYAATLFRKTFGTTLNALITRHRVAHAQRQLVTSEERIVNIAQDSGFDSLSRFNRAFKQIAGTTPRQYRKTLGQSPEGVAPRPR
jgi:AraC family transcriptional regulator, melibiose operon regulatory protein